MFSKQKHTILTLTILLFTSSAFAQMQDHFVTTWKTDNLSTNSSDTSSITIPTHPDESYLYDVDWNNDGIFDDIAVTGDITHDFGVIGTYTIRIKGNFPSIYFNDGKFGYGLDKKKIISIDQWGSQQWTTMQAAFYGCSNLIGNYTDTPDLSIVTDISEMFRKASIFNSPLDSWNVSSVTYMYGVFADAINFNQELNSWDVSSVYNTFAMFAYATSFNQALNNWNISSLTDMEAMFRGAESFNQNINDWDVSNVQNMEAAFMGASSFNQALDNWNVSSVTKMHKMFQNAINFDQNIGSWDIRNVVDMTNMFLGATLSTSNYDELLIGWNSLASPGLQANVIFNGGNSKYCVAGSERANMINSNNWTITDNGIDGTGTNCITNIEELLTSNNIAIYPTINNGSFTISLESDVSKLELNILNQLGQVVYTDKLTNKENNINLENKTSGIYKIQIIADTNTITKSIIIQ